MSFLNEIVLESPVPTLIDVSYVYGTGCGICREGFAIKVGGKNVFVKVVGGI